MYGMGIRINIGGMDIDVGLDGVRLGTNQNLAVVDNDTDQPVTALVIEPMGTQDGPWNVLTHATIPPQTTADITYRLARENAYRWVVAIYPGGTRFAVRVPVQREASFGLRIPPPSQLEMKVGPGSVGKVLTDRGVVYYRPENASGIRRVVVENSNRAWRTPPPGEGYVPPVSEEEVVEEAPTQTGGFGIAVAAAAAAAALLFFGGS